jgi:hypothetical protein
MGFQPGFSGGIRGSFWGTEVMKLAIERERGLFYWKVLRSDNSVFAEGECGFSSRAACEADARSTWNIASEAFREDIWVSQS